MTRELYRYGFSETVPIEEAKASLLLAILATESLHGGPQTRLDAGHVFDPAKRACVIDAGTPVGRDINRLFTGFIEREFGPDSFNVELIEGQNHGDAAKQRPNSGQRVRSPRQRDSVTHSPTPPNVSALLEHTGRREHLRRSTLNVRD